MQLRPRLLFSLIALLFTIPSFGQDYSRIDRDLSTVEITEVIKTGAIVTNAHVQVHIVDVDGNEKDRERWIGEQVTASIISEASTKNEVLALEGQAVYDILHKELNPTVAQAPEAPSGGLAGTNPFGESDLDSNTNSLNTKITAKEAEISALKAIIETNNVALVILQNTFSALKAVKNQ